MKKIFLFIITLFVVFTTSQTSTFAAVCDQSFNGGMLRYDKAYRFYDVLNNNNNYHLYMNNFWVSYKQPGQSSWNEGAARNWSYLDPGSDYEWTQELRNNGFRVNKNSSMRIFETGPTNWRIKKKPTTRTNGTTSSYDFALRYKVSFDSSNNYPNTNDDILHTECVYYSVTWCGDGVRDSGYETCDPNDPNKVGWGNGGCNNSCEPITVDPPATCDSITTTPGSGTAPLSVSVSCQGTNVTTYKIQCGNGKVINSRTGTCEYTLGGNYNAQCIVDDSITSNACKKTIKVNNPTPYIRIDKVDANSSDLDGNIGNDTQTVVKGEEAVFKIRVTNQGEESLRNLKVNDPIAPNCAGNVTLPNSYPSTWSNFKIGGSGNHNNNVLEVGEWYEYTCKKGNTQSAYDNEATTEGTGVISGTKVTDYDDTHVLLVDPEIQVVKVDKNPNDDDGRQGNDTQTVLKGEEAIFEITVTNNGTEDLKNIVLTDALAPACDSNGSNVNLSGKNFTNKEGNTVTINVSGAGNHNDNIFQIGERFTYTCAKDNTQSNYTNVVRVDGVGVDSNKSVNDDDPSEVIVKEVPEEFYDLALRKTLAPSSPGPFNRGGEVTFEIEIFNQGNVDSGVFSVTDYIPTGLTLNDSAWSQVDNKAQRNVSNIVAGQSRKVTIAFTIDDDAPLSIDNFAEIHDDSGLDCDSSPDQNNTDPLINDEIGQRCDTNDNDEDDHDIETITIVDNATCDGLTADPMSAEGTLTSNLVCSGTNVSSFLLEVVSGSGDVVFTSNTATGTVTLTGTGLYTASCYVNGRDTTPNVCQKTLEVRPEIEDVFDLALRKTLSDTTPAPFDEEDTVTFDIEVFNQGNISATAQEIVDYIPAGLTLNDTDWTQVGDKAYYDTDITLAPGTSQTIQITFTIDIGAPRTINNFAEIHEANGDDCDSTPDDDNGNDGTLINDAIGTACEPGGDEDDHDIETITVGDVVSSCTNLTASPRKAEGSLTSQLSCTGNAATSFLIEVRNSSNTVVFSTTNSTGSVTLNSEGTYTASCFVNGETETSNACQQTLEVEDDGGSGGQLACQNATQSGSIVTCQGTTQARSSYLNCNGVKKGPINTTKVDGKFIATFDCSAGSYQCYVDDDTVPTSDIGDTDSNWFKAQAWRTSNACHVTGGGGPTCGNGIIESGEQCDYGSPFTSERWGRCYTPGSANECTLRGGGDPDPVCDNVDGCIVTTPDDGELIFGPVGTVIIGHGQNPLDQTGEPYVYNNSNYDFSFEEVCMKAFGDTSSIIGDQYCANITNDVLYAYEREYLTPKPDYKGDKDGIPSGKSYGEVVLKTSIKDEGVFYYDSYLHSQLEVRVAKPAVVTVGGGTSYVKDSSTTGDVQDITDGVGGYNDNKNFVGTSVSDSGISSHADSIDASSNSGAVTDTEADKDIYEESVSNVIENTSVLITDTVSSFSGNYNGLSNVYIVSGKNVELSSMPSISESSTFIVEGGGDLFITGDMITSENVAFVVKGGDIIFDKDVVNVKGTYIAIPVDGNGGEIRGNGGTDKQLVVNGSLYGDITDLVNDRYYIDSTGSQLSVGTIVSFGSSLFTQPAPLVSQFIGEYLQAEKVAQ